jgi:NAD(P)-dependent dehydrogenase (short-subunit alcohol dehydrogenase family)
MSARTRWTTRDIPDQTGRIAVVTGANSGIGYEAAKGLALAGATVVLACRDAAKGEAAAESIRAAGAGVNVEPASLDLASLASVRAFARSFAERHTALHALVNNAGVMGIPRRTTAEGFEMQLGTNHLGHFALTGLLLERLLAGDGARVVNVSSLGHRRGRIDFEDLHGERSYARWRAYYQSKLANLLFTYELQRRLEAAAGRCISVACHPGFTATNLQLVGPRMDGSRLMTTVWSGFNRVFAQDAARGALPTLYAATAPDVQGGDYIGPGGFQEARGYPRKVESNARSHDGELARRLWDVSETLTGVRYKLETPAGDT